MRQIISCVETHTCGEPTRIITGGLLNLPGDTMVAKQAYVRDHLDHVRRALIREPRGHRGMFGAILTPPVSPNAVGVVEMALRLKRSCCTARAGRRPAGAGPSAGPKWSQ